MSFASPVQICTCLPNKSQARDDPLVLSEEVRKELSAKGTKGTRKGSASANDSFYVSALPPV